MIEGETYRTANVFVGAPGLFSNEPEEAAKSVGREIGSQKGVIMLNALKVAAAGLALACGATAGQAAVVVKVGTVNPNIFYNVAPAQISGISNFKPGSTV